MSDFGGQKSSTEEPPPFLSTYSRYSGLWDAKNASASAVNAATATWTTTNMARYYPVSLPFAYPVRRVFWINGTAATNNRTFAIYNADYQQLYTTGATGASGASLPQFVDTRTSGCRPVTTSSASTPAPPPMRSSARRLPPSTGALAGSFRRRSGRTPCPTR